MIEIRRSTLNQCDLESATRRARLVANPDVPTKARPGSTDKLAVMIARYEAGYELFHSGDVNNLAKPGEATLRSNMFKTRLNGVEPPQTAYEGYGY